MEAKTSFCCHESRVTTAKIHFLCCEPWGMVVSLSYATYQQQEMPLNVTKTTQCNLPTGGFGRLNRQTHLVFDISMLISCTLYVKKVLSLEVLCKNGLLRYDFCLKRLKNLWNTDLCVLKTADYSLTFNISWTLSKNFVSRGCITMNF